MQGAAVRCCRTRNCKREEDKHDHGHNRQKAANLSWPRWSLRDFFTRELFLHALFHWRCADTARYPENHAWQRIESSYCYRQANGRVLPVDMGLSIFAESVGAICLVVGLFTRLAA